MPPHNPTHPDSATPADILTPHDQAPREPVAGVDPDAEPGIVDPRRLGPEILDPPPAGLPPPEKDSREE